jgi:acylphosphatase
MIRKHTIVRGEVQGVGFRYHAQATATHLGVSGYTRNLTDGTVELEIEGDESAVERMLEWLGVGPAWATVTAVDVTDVAPTGETGFRILS